MAWPFTVEQFFEVFADYNRAVWPAQVALNLLAVLAAGLLLAPRPFADRAIAAILALFWLWMAVAYHFIFFSRINPAAWAFGALFVAGAAGLGWVGVVRGRVRFAVRGRPREGAGAALIVFALLVYPAIGYLLGHPYPVQPTFGLPCPTTIFTLGILLFAQAPVPRSVFAVPLAWSAIGSTAAFELGVLEDLGLLVAGVLGLLGAVFSPAPVRATGSESEYGEY